MALPTSFSWVVRPPAPSEYLYAADYMGSDGLSYGFVIQSLDGTSQGVALNHTTWVYVWEQAFSSAAAQTWVAGLFPNSVQTGGPVSGRYVRVQLNQPGYLALAEVIVERPDGLDIALNQPATQSSTLEGADASRAVDGKTDGIFADGSVSHTNQDSPAWWQVDLGAVVQVGGVIIWNRTDLGCADQPGGVCGLRLSNFTVSISNNADGSSPVWSSVQTAPPSPSVSIKVGS